ncbi:proline racemase family protein [Wenzhouxiangella sp. AB-CW3]|uniref:proline racemase family protein n=1 Tax=Wenzhouxiangella sp. AB-CW3 TaxID=2771012 RepID=UPI00168BAFFE|nr:proline racemase family protein [Wenzhouxiangella sp. AB-CW3]QOC21971.1 proline racemase family protein [Wenzhouxiangella sp. AB-CW3]
MDWIEVMDSHTAGEPTRVVLSGFPDLGQGDVLTLRQRFAERHDAWRRAIVCEPRGSDVLVGALLVPPVSAQACTGVIFFNNVGYLGMCGHGLMGVARTLLELGRIGYGRHWVDTAVGLVSFDITADGCISLENVESYRHQVDVELTVPGHGLVRGDVAWGGNWFYITYQPPCSMCIANARELGEYAESIRKALRSQGISGPEGAEIDHIKIEGWAPDGSGQARNFVLCPGLVYDRSPCGTGTSAKVACLAADQRLAEGELWVQQGILGTRFLASYRRGERGVIPRISGQAHVTGRSRLLIDPDDPFAWGIANEAAA